MTHTKYGLQRGVGRVKRLKAIAVAGGASLTALSLLLAPALATSAQRDRASRPSVSMNGRPIGAFTPAVSDPRLAGALARRGDVVSFTPAASSPTIRPIRSMSAAPSRSPATSISPAGSAIGSPRTGSPRSPATSGATARRSMSGRRSASRRFRPGSRRRSPPIHKPRTKRAFARAPGPFHQAR